MIVCGGRRGLLSDPALVIHFPSGKALAFWMQSFQQGGARMSADPIPQESYWSSSNDPKWIETFLAPLHLERRWKQRATLEKFGFRRFLFARRVLFDSVVWALVLAFFGGLWWLHSEHQVLGIHPPTDYATAVVTIFVFVLAYYQWRSSRYEKAMEDFYSRLGLANRRRERLALISKLMGHPWDLKGANEYSEALCGDDDHHWSMYVYAELDNLEYVVEKYNLGYMQARHALRGLRTFYQRCARPAFRYRALKCARCMAYNESTVQVVRKVCEDIEDRRSRPRPPRGHRLASILWWRGAADKAA
jgi:hypothetical protein